MNNRSKNPELGEFLRSRRQSLGLSLDDVADASGLHRSYWSKLESGQYEAPAPKHLQTVGRVLNLPIEDLYALCGYAIPERLPSFKGYLRSTTNLSAEAIRQLEIYMGFLRQYYEIPDDQPVFPPRPKVDHADEQDETTNDERSVA